MMMTHDIRRTLERAIATLAVSTLAVAFAVPAPAADAGVRSKIVAAFGKVASYKLLVLGSVRSTGVFVAPDRYHMTTEIEGKPLETVIVGRAYWTRSNGKWERSGTTSTNLQVDISSLIPTMKRSATSAFSNLPTQTQDGKKVGTFAFAFPDGTDETCNYSLTTYLITRCKADEVTLLYSGYNDPKNTVPKV
jgi:hypothetical protein